MEENVFERVVCTMPAICPVNNGLMISVQTPVRSSQPSNDQYAECISTASFSIAHGYLIQKRI